MNKHGTYHSIKKLIARRYRPIADSERWMDLLQSEYGIAKGRCFIGYKKTDYMLFAESVFEFDSRGSIRKSGQRLFNTKLLSSYDYTIVYDVHCKLGEWSMTYENEGNSVEFPQSVLLQPVKMAFSYNEYGDVATVTDDHGECAFEYQYDVNSLWTKRLQLESGKCVEIVVRNIEYWKNDGTRAESDVDAEEEGEEVKLVETQEEESEEEEKPELEQEEDVEEAEPEPEEPFEEEEMVSEEDNDKETSEEEDAIVGKQVRHKIFGVGMVETVETMSDKQYITVLFGSNRKRFQYPNAFNDGFLSFSNFAED